jgi:hypothetical protein
MDHENKPGPKDIAYALAKAGVSQIPIVGAVASELLGLIVTPPMEKRKQKLITEIGEKLRELESTKSLQLDDLSKNDQFIDTVAQATALALKTSDQEKIIAFKNAIFNTALGETPDKTLSQIFLSLIDRFTTLHIQILRLFDNPQDWFRQHHQRPPALAIGGLSHVIIAAYPDLNNQQDLMNIVWNDLQAAGLHNTPSMNATMTGDGLMQSRLTTMGRQFLQYISDNG